MADLFRERLDLSRAGGPTFIPTLITSGAASHWVESALAVPKAGLVSAMDTLLSFSRLWVAPDLLLWPVLAQELRDFRVKRTETGRETFAAGREGEHDDLVLSLSLACWWGNQMDRRPRGAFTVVKPGTLSL